MINTNAIATFLLPLGPPRIGALPDLGKLDNQIGENVDRSIYRQKSRESRAGILDS